MKITVVFNGKTGFTKRYASWIAEELNCPVLRCKELSQKIIDANDIVIFGSRIHAGKIEYLNRVKKLFATANNTNLIVFATGATPLAAQNVIEEIWSNNFSKSELKHIPRFYIQSGLNYEKMNFFDRTIMKLAAKIMGRKNNKSEDEIGFEQAIKTSYDISSKEFIFPLVNFVRTQTR